MASQVKRQRRSEAFYWLTLGLIVFPIVGIVVYILVVWRPPLLGRRDVLSVPRVIVDEVRLNKLQHAILADGDPPASPGDWPQWRGPGRSGLSLETGLSFAWPKKGPPVVWKKPAGGGYSTVAVASGRVYTLLQDGDNEAAVCWDADSGEEKWRFRYACSYSDTQGGGPRSTPALAGDRVYTVGATGLMHCLEARTGKKIWQHDLLKEFNANNLGWGVSFSPLVEGNLVLTNPGGSGGSSIVAFDAASGDVVWKTFDDGAGYSSPVVSMAAGRRQVLFFTAGNLVSVAPEDGKVMWKYAWQTNFNCNVATPIPVGDYVFISSGYGKGCALLEVSALGKELQADPVYENDHMRNHFASSVLYQEHIYGFDDAMLVCLELRTGAVKWKEQGFHKGSLLIADGHLIVLSEQGKLAVARATPEAYREKASYQVSRRKCWTVPVLAQGKLYVRDEQQIVCLDLKKSSSAAP
jgi:outer membrane protein assembly factor BamB